MRYKSIFSYYGGKSKIAHLYPPPKHDRIIEPFAGAAAYCARYHEHECIINDLDPKTASIWEFLLSDDAEKEIRKLPETIEKGVRISERFAGACPGMIAFLQSQANMGTMGGRAVWDCVTFVGSVNWRRIKPRSLFWIPRIRHWQLTSKTYQKTRNQKATWFVDPPYANAAGDRYRLGSSQIDFQHLAQWCQSRKGQAIVCENQGADWLPFEYLADRVGVNSRHRKSNTSEVMWTQG